MSKVTVMTIPADVHYNIYGLDRDDMLMLASLLCKCQGKRVVNVSDAISLALYGEGDKYGTLIDEYQARFPNAQQKDPTYQNPDYGS